MEHLTVEEIIKYVTANKVDRETVDLLSKVNGHIRKCPACEERVSAFECVNEALEKATFENDLDLNHFDELIKTEREFSGEYYAL
ncbi:MAG: hypothetical protein IJE14_00905 [Clostridia bacterium]|nr:hypothetical protein [Clostridia bacterium]MBQ6930868.1 hypothetical protein [Clostridia bacterium]